jgi:hypothetical protein
MHRISTGFSMVALIAALGCLSLPHDGRSAAMQVAANKPDFSTSGVDLMSVGTSKQVSRMKRARAERKA